MVTTPTIQFAVKPPAKKPKIKDAGQRPGDPKILVASFKKINRELGWEPKELLEKGLQKTINFFKSHFAFIRSFNNP